MQMVDVILKKREGKSLTREEIQFFVEGFVTGEIPDYQASALLMAICLNGMTEQETSDLTDAMTHSGDVVDLSPIGTVVADKHSTGGVADSTTLLVIPMCAACGVPMAKLSGRGLGHTGGTLDKLEAIPGFSVEQPIERFISLVKQNGAAVIGQSAELAPADKKIYALRDVTGTVESIPLIASSIMSKKLAAGSNVIVLDVKTGSGAFMQKEEDAFELAEAMVSIGEHLGRKVVALVSDMNQPLGDLIGNAMDVYEAIELLKGRNQTSDLMTVSYVLGILILQSAGIEADENKAFEMLVNSVMSGAALNKLRAIIASQGGNPRVCDTPEIMGVAKESVLVPALSTGYIANMNNTAIGRATQMIGAGRAVLEDVIDPTVGLEMHVRLGDYVEKGEPLAVFKVNDKQYLEQAIRMVTDAIKITSEKPQTPKLLYGIADKKGVRKF